jgi:hypothetical protein
MKKWAIFILTSFSCFLLYLAPASFALNGLVYKTCICNPYAIWYVSTFQCKFIALFASVIHWMSHGECHNCNMDIVSYTEISIWKALIRVLIALSRNSNAKMV